MTAHDCGAPDVGAFCIGCGGLCSERSYSPHWIVRVCLSCGWDDDPDHEQIIGDVPDTHPTGLPSPIDTKSGPGRRFPTPAEP